MQFHDQPVDFSAWLRSDLPRNTRNAAVYFERDTLAVDFVVDHARLADDLTLLAKTLGWPDLGALPRAKSHTRRGRHIDWSAADRAYVQQAFAAEVKLYEQVRKGYFRERLQADSPR